MLGSFRLLKNAIIFVFVSGVILILIFEYYNSKLKTKLTISKHQSLNLFQLKEDFSYQHPPIDFSPDLLNKNLDECLVLPHAVYEVDKTEKDGSTRRDNLNLSLNIEKILEFTNLMKGSLRIETVLLEPSILFCMLSSEQKTLLLKRNFTLDSYIKQKKIITMGIKGGYTDKLYRMEVQQVIREAGFQMEYVKAFLPDWMRIRDYVSVDNHFTSHIFFLKKGWTFHLVVFYPRSTFYWHAALTHQLTANLPSKKDLYFIESDSAYESFDLVSLSFKGDLFRSINIPSNPQFFLFEIQSSRFVECNSTVVSRFKEAQSTAEPEKHSSFSKEKFDYRTSVAIQELKHRFHPLLIHFWMWSGTMLGWYRECGIIPHTNDIDFAAWASEVDVLDTLLRLFSNYKEHLDLTQRMGLVETGLELRMDCHGLRVDLFFLYPENNTFFWVAGHRPSHGYYYKYSYQKFSLCSTEFLNQKVLVPCETESVIVPEYGTDWMTPKSSWYYESAPLNIGPKIYWDKDLLKKVYSAII